MRRVMACVLLLSCLSACTRWEVQEASPQQVLADEQPAKVRVTLTDGSRVVLKQPVVSGDALTGLREREQVSIPFASVSELELREHDTVKSIALATGIVVGVPALLFGVVLITCAISPDASNCS